MAREIMSTPKTANQSRGTAKMACLVDLFIGEVASSEVRLNLYRGIVRERAPRYAGAFVDGGWERNYSCM